MAISACRPPSEDSELFDPGLRFSPAAFFVGETRGEGTIDPIMGSSHRFRVRSLGRMEPDGTIDLRQLIAEQGKAPRRRRWRLRETSPSLWRGALSDGDPGDVRGQVAGNRLRLVFREDGYLVTQQLFLQPGGGIVLNRMRIRRYGVTVAHVRETIEHVAPLLSPP